MSDYLTIAQAAERMHYTERQIRKMCIEGKLPGAFKIGSGRKWHIPEEALVEIPSKGTGTKEAIVSARQEHWNDLADLAGEAAQGFYLRSIAGDFWDVLKRRGHGHGDTEASPGVGPFFSESVFEIRHPLEPFDWKKAFADELGSATRKHSLIVHLDSEFKGFSNKLQDWKKYALWHHRWKMAGDATRLPHEPSEVERRLDSLTEEIIEVLNMVAERRTFMGSCEVCKDW